jgi:hypothetical protein
MCPANKQFSAVIPVICKVFQTGKLFSAITQVICTVFGSYSNHLQSLLGEKADFCDHSGHL